MTRFTQRADALERRVDAVAVAALAEALTGAWRDVLTDTLTAAGTTPDTGGLGRLRDTWGEALRRWVRPVVAGAYARAWSDVTGAGPTADVIDAWWGRAAARMEQSIDAVIGALRETVRSQPTYGIPQLRDAVARVLQLDAGTQTIRDQIASVEAQLANTTLSGEQRAALFTERERVLGLLLRHDAARAHAAALEAQAQDLDPDQRQQVMAEAQRVMPDRRRAELTDELRALDAQLYRPPDMDVSRRGDLRTRRAGLYAQLRRSEETWLHTATRIARTESTGVLNRASYDAHGHLAQQQGVQLLKRWTATVRAGKCDDRTRPTHCQAHGQVRAWGEPFQVGESRLMLPGDPEGAPAEVIQCRCTFQAGTAADFEAVDQALAASAHNQEVQDVTVRTARTAADHVTAAADDLARAGDAAGSGLPIGWRGVLLPMNTRSGDRRMYRSPAGELRLRQYPLTFLWQESLAEHHDGAVAAGNITRVWIEGNNLMGEGTYDHGSDAGLEAARQLHQGIANGVSVDLDDLVVEFDEVNELIVIPDWRLMGATQTPQPAFDEARIYPVYADDEAQVGLDDDMLQLVAAAVDEALPPVFQAADFTPPVFTEATPLIVTSDGRVFGHLAAWGTCHIGFQGTCVTPPHTAAGYAYFHTGYVVTEDGQELAVGKLTLGAGHADPRAGVKGAVEHYDNSAKAVAVVRASEDEHGIVVAGRLLPTATDEQVAELRRSPLSGDWRRVGANLEMVAALGVNVPGFPIPRTIAASAHGVQTSLVAAGIVTPDTVHAMSEREVSAAVKAAMTREVVAQRLEKRLGLDPETRAAQLAARVGVPESTTTGGK
jgi:hypothetical protein